MVKKKPAKKVKKKKPAKKKRAAKYEPKLKISGASMLDVINMGLKYDKFKK